MTMTDEQMDARLRTAGDNWRASNDTIPEARPSARPVETITRTPPRASRRIGLFASAAAVVAAMVVGGVFLLHGTGGKQTSNDGASFALKGTVWRLTGYGNDQQRTNSLATMYIDNDGNVVADDSCTVVGAHLDIQDGRLYPTGDFDLRYRDCTDPGGELTFTDAFEMLTSFPSYSVGGSALTLSAPGEPRMHFTAAPGLVRPTIDVPTFLGAKWMLTRVSDGHGTDHPVAGAPTLQVKNGQLSASDGCNTLSGPAAVDGHNVDLKQLASTAMGCVGSRLATAAVIDQVFGGSTVHEQVEGTRLTVKGDGAGTLVYQWAPADKAAVDPARLIGKTWHLASVAGDAAVGDATLRIDKSGRLTGRDGCQDLDATADVGSGMITTHGVPNDPPATCEGATKAQASTTDSFLQADALWAIRDGKLLIYGGGAQAFALVYGGQAPAAAPDTADELRDTAWRLTGVAIGTGHPSLVPGTGRLKLIFGQDPGIGYDDGVNYSSGGVDIGNGTLAIGNLSSTLVGCGDGDPSLCTQSQDIDRILTGKVTWSIAVRLLTVTKPGVGYLHYVQITASQTPTGPASSTRTP
jgi:heat shock protein HslJ